MQPRRCAQRPFGPSSMTLRCVTSTLPSGRAARNLERGYANPEWQASVQRLLKDPHLHVSALPRVYEVAMELHPGEEVS
jgi:hypothetical protein